MSLIRSLRPGGSNPTLARESLNKVQNTALTQNLESAQRTNVRTLGRQQLRGPELLSAFKNYSASPGALKLRAKPHEAAKEVENGVSVRSDGKLLKQKEKFLSSFLRLDSESTEQLAERTGDSLGTIEANGGAAEATQVLAAHTHNHARKLLKEKLPGADPAQLREAAQSDPEVGQALEVLNAASGYLKASRNAPSPTPAADKSQALARAKALAEQAAQTHQNYLQMSEIYTQIHAERLKTAAQIHELAAATSQQISDMMMKGYLNRLKLAGKFHQKMVYLVSDNWPRA
ncbi:MAG: hypothetical protein WC314_15800 [Vulcanimicrobiota bacterium]